MYVGLNVCMYVCMSVCLTACDVMCLCRGYAAQSLCCVDWDMIVCMYGWMDGCM